MQRRILFFLILICTRLDLIRAAEKYDPTTLVFPPYLHTYGIRKATRTHLFLFVQNRTRFNNPQGLAAVRLKSWDNPATEKDDDEVTVYGVNSGDNNIIYNTSMTGLGIYGLQEASEQRLNNSHGIAANADGDVFVADTGNDRVLRLINPGKQLQFVTAIGKKGSGPGEFNKPYDVKLDVEKNIYVSDSGNNRIQILNAAHQFIREISFSTGTDLINPGGIALIHEDAEWNFYKESFLIVIDSLNQRLQKFSLIGGFLAKKNTRQFGFSKANLQYADIDYYGNIYVTDLINHCIHKFNRNLGYITSYGRKGSGDKEFIEPRGFTIYYRFGQIFVAEAMGAQYYWIGTDVFNFKMVFDAEKNLMTTRFFLTEPAFVTADIYNEKGLWVTRLFQKRFMNSGTHEDCWQARMYATKKSLPDGKEVVSAFKDLKFLPGGKYFITYTFEPTYSSLNYFSKEMNGRFTIFPKK
ncbi:6-bladed beta-propeller [candidate division KSB1 bacterium]|nr:6-bladed beta-propeller [candidate division KSB1 bacterium]